jgi:L1 cell adhesion molecule like protein
VPQIEVTFDIDANGILNVSALDKAGGKSQNITITNEKGRLSQADIDKMVSEAEKYAAEDAAQKEKIEAKNSIENMCYQLKSSVEGDLKDKLEEADKESLTKKIDETLQWLESNQLAEKEEFEAKQKELEAVSNPIMMKAYQQGGGAPGAGGMPGGMPGGGFPDMGADNAGPQVEEVD